MTDAGEGILKLKFTRRGRTRDLVWAVALIAIYAAFWGGLSGMIGAVSTATGWSRFAAEALVFLFGLLCLSALVLASRLTGGSGRRQDAARSVLAFVRSHGPIRHRTLVLSTRPERYRIWTERAIEDLTKSDRMTHSGAGYEAPAE